MALKKWGILFLLFIVGSTLASMVLGLFVGQMNRGIALVSLAAGGILSCFMSRFISLEVSWEDEGNGSRIKKFEWVVFGFILLSAYYYFAFILYRSDGEIKTLHPNNLGDLPLHLAYMRHIASGAWFWPSNPIFSADLVRYPLGMDLFNALLETLNWPTSSHLFLTGVGSTAVALLMAHRYGGWLLVGGIFLSGGLISLEALQGNSWSSYQNGIAWKNFFVSMWITQRGWLFALPAGLYVLHEMEGRLTESTDHRGILIPCILWASLSYFHLHSFFIISLYLGGLSVFHRSLWTFRRAFFWVGLTGFLYVIHGSDGFQKASVIHLQWGWMAKDFLFWIKNFGVFFVLLSVTFYFVRGHRGQVPFYFALFLFLLFLNMMLAPWAWDNIKILFWIYIVLLKWTWESWVKDISEGPANVIAGCFFAYGIVSISVVFGSQGVSLFKSGEVEKVRALLEKIPTNEALATAPSYNHPVFFWGRKVFKGYDGHLWSHGIDAQLYSDSLKKIYRQEGRWLALARELNIRYLYWGEREKSYFKSKKWDDPSGAGVVSSYEDMKIFDLQLWKEQND